MTNYDKLSLSLFIQSHAALFAEFFPTQGASQARAIDGRSAAILKGYPNRGSKLGMVLPPYLSHRALIYEGTLAYSF
jgi:hypothetical protein